MKCDRDESGTEYGGIEHEHIKLLSLSSPPTAPLPCRVIIPAHGPTQDSCHHKAPRCAFSILITYRSVGFTAGGRAQWTVRVCVC